MDKSSALSFRDKLVQTVLNIHFSLNVWSLYACKLIFINSPSISVAASESWYLHLIYIST